MAKAHAGKLAQWLSSVKPFRSHTIQTASKKVTERPMIASEDFLHRVQAAWNMKSNKFFGDGFLITPNSAKHFFTAILVANAFSAANYITDNNPQIFQRTLFIHQPYASLLLSFWGGSYIGMEIAKYGFGSKFYKYLGGLPRTLIGLSFFATGTAALIIGHFDPWLSYKTLVGGYTALTLMDIVSHRTHLAPSYFLKPQILANGSMIGILLLALWKGPYLAEHADEIIIRAAHEATDMPFTEPWQMPGWMLTLFGGK